MSNLEIRNSLPSPSQPDVTMPHQLEGGDPGQTIIKSSGADFDYHWASMPAPALTPLTHAYAVSPFIISSTTSVQTPGRLIFYPLWVGNLGYKTNAFRINVTTAQSGGTATLEVALYANDQANDIPDGTKKLASTRGFTMSVSGSTAATFNEIALAPGLYWLATLYMESSHPTTVPTFTSIQNAQNILAQSSDSLGSATRAYKLESQTGIPTTAINLSDLIPSTDADPIVVGVYRSV